MRKAFEETPLVYLVLTTLHITISGMEYVDDRKQDLTFLELVLAFCVEKYAFTAELRSSTL